MIFRESHKRPGRFLLFCCLQRSIKAFVNVNKLPSVIYHLGRNLMDKIHKLTEHFKDIPYLQAVLQINKWLFTKFTLMHMLANIDHTTRNIIIPWLRYVKAIIMHTEFNFLPLVSYRCSVFYITSS